ncbi:MAG: PH domain-containing protein [Euzebya sp.]
MVTLYIPRAISLVTGSLGVLWPLPTVAILLGGGAVNPGFALSNVVIAAGLLYFAVRTWRIQVVLDIGGIDVRSRVRTRSVEWHQVKGIALLQDGGAPKLRVVVRGGDPLVVPAWSLRARHEDGETEGAADALSRFGSAHGVKVRVRQLTGPVVD